MFSRKTDWKQRLIRFLVYVVVGFACAFLYNNFRNKF